MRLPPWVLAVVAAIALAGVTMAAQPGDPGSAPRVLAVPAVSAPAASVTDWPEVVRALDAVRVAAYADPLSADPSRWVDTACPCLAVEQARLQSLGRGGRSVRAVAPVLRDVQVVSISSDRVTIEVTDVLAAYDVVGAGGRPVRYAGRGALTWRGVLVRRGDGWRWADLRPAGHDRGTGVDRGGDG